MARETRLLAVALGALAVCGAVAAGCRLASTPAVPDGHDAAIVLLSGPNRLVTVDLRARRVVAQKPLRSLALDVAVDGASGLAVTAQCGGLGDAADDAVGIYDIRGGGPVAYERLPRANPGVVTCADGHAYVEHGIYEDGGLFLSEVDPVRRKVVRTGIAPDGPGVSMVRVAGGLAVLASTGADAGPLRVVDIRTSDLSTRAVSVCPAGTSVLTTDGDGGLALFGCGSSTQHTGGAWFAEWPGSAGVTTTPIPLSSVGSACLTSRYAIAAPGDDGGPARRSSLAIVDRTSRRPVTTLTLDGVALDVCPWGERVLVVTRDPCRLIAMDPTRARVIFDIDLGAANVVGADVEALAAGTAGRGVSGRASP